MHKDLACACGDQRFRVRIDRDQQVGLLTCSRDHHSFLLDSSDHWDDVIQAGRPREKRCKCGGRSFHVGLDYEMREDGDVRTVSVEVGCVACEKRAVAAAFEIDYSPTDALLSQPLEPCAEPWLVPKRSELTALWTPRDLGELVRYLGSSENVRCYFAGFKEPLRVATPDSIMAALAGHQFFRLYFSTREVEFPDNPRDCWKRLPVIHVSSPTTINYKTGTGLLYYMEWAEQFIVERQIVAQEPALLALASRLQAWLCTQFTSARGKRTFDNKAEFERLKGGW